VLEVELKFDDEPGMHDILNEIIALRRSL